MAKPWKRNLRKIPAAIMERINSKGKNDLGDDLVVTTAKRISLADIEKGVYSHLGLTVANGHVSYEPLIMPPISSGRYSKRNQQGREIVRRNLPKIERDYSWTAPNFGDASKGYHDVHMTRQVYQRDQEPPYLISIVLEQLDDPNQLPDMVSFSFRLDAPLDRTCATFETDLLYHLNLLQENVGVVNIFPSSVTHDDYLKTLMVHWEILPPGERDETLASVCKGLKFQLTPQEQALMMERYQFLVGQEPESFVVGSSGFQRYFGAKFNDNFVVFENIRYGNAAYAMLGDWQTLSQMSRLDLLSSIAGNGTHNDFMRFVHTAGWDSRLTHFISKHRGN